MVVLDLPAFMECEEKGCDARVAVRLILQGGGGFAFRPDTRGWQVLLPQGGAGLVSSYKTHCPKHATHIETARKVIAHG